MDLMRLESDDYEDRERFNRLAIRASFHLDTELPIDDTISSRFLGVFWTSSDR